jgi:prefoldin alpha subunit
MANPVRIELDKLSVEQLKGLKEQTDLEVNLLQDSLTKIRTANARFENASGALQDLSLRPQGKNPVPFFPAQRDSSALPFLRSVDLV